MSVMDSAYSRRSGWELRDVVPLSREEENQTFTSFEQDALSGKLSLNWVAPDGSWGEDAATPTECAGLERAAVWSASHVEDRLRDYRAGRPNTWVRPLKQRANVWTPSPPWIEVLNSRMQAANDSL